jgi:hypothetical protein
LIFQLIRDSEIISAFFVPNQSRHNTRESRVKRHRLLFGLVTVLGIVFLTSYFVVTWSSAISEAVSTFLSLQLWNLFVPFCLLGGISFLTVGLIGLGRQRLWNQTIMKHSRLLFAFIVLLGAFLVTAFFAIVYWSNTFSAEILTVQIANSLAVP